MAGRGSRLRPHSLTTPKPLISVAGSPIVNQLVYEIAKVVTEPITDIGFVLGDPTYFDEAVEDSLKSLATELGATPHIFRQLERLRAMFEENDEEGNLAGLSKEGQNFLETSYNNDGYIEAYSKGASEDFIYDVQDEWNLNFFRD